MKRNIYKKFNYRIRPHKILKEEYPQEYYKFRDGRVASAFFMETLGQEVRKLPMRRVREPKNNNV